MTRVKADVGGDPSGAAGPGGVTDERAGGATEPGAPAARPMRRVGRRLRLVAAAVVFGALLLGTIRGQDSDFPFGPFRMYATRQRPDGVSASYRIEAITAEGRLMFVPGAAYGMRRAEIEGQIPRFVARPALLSQLAVAYHRRRPDAPELVEIHLVRRRQQLEGSRPTGPPVDQVVATWHR